MKITDIRLAKLNVPLKTPFKTALRTVDHVEDIVVIIETDTGLKGYGSAAPTAVITGDTIGSIKSAIVDFIKPKIIGKKVEDLNYHCISIQNSMVNNSSAKAAVEIALYDLFAQGLGVPLYKALGGGDPKLTTDVTISVDYIDKMVEDALKAVDLGYETLKLKVGKDIGLDIERVKAVYSAVKDNALIRLDANQGWTAKQTVHAVQTLENAGVQLELIEQPVPGRDIDGLKYIYDRVNTPIMADESSFGPMEVIELIQRQATDIVNVKLMKTGGLSRAIQIADIASLYHIECMMGCMLESSIGVAAAAHLAAAKPNIITKVDLDAPSLCQYNPVKGGVVFSGADITLNETPGLGIESIEGLEFI